MKHLLVLFSMLLLRADLSAQTTFIRSQDWASIVENARTNQKLIFVDAYTDWCGWCKVMDEKTFSNETIGNIMNQNFINVKLEMEKEDLGKQLAMKYAVSAFPTYLIFNGKGEMIYQTFGYQEPTAFMTTLFSIINPENHVSRPGYTPGFTAAYPDFYLNAMGMTKKKKFPEAEEVNEWATANKDLSIEANWTVYKRFYWFMNASNRNNFWEQMPALDSLYGHDMVADLSLNLLYKATEEEVKENNPAKFEDLLKSRLPLVDDPREAEKSVRLYYATETQNWKEVNRLLSALFKEEGAENTNFWNQKCWDIYEKADDSLLVQNALIWIDEVVKIDPDYNHIDTYAALLFKAGKLEEAEDKAMQAIGVGKQGNKNVKETEALLLRIQEARQRNRH